MRLEEYVTDADFKIGDKVSIESGPLEGFIGTISELDDIMQHAKVDIVMFGRPQDVEVDYVQMKKILDTAVEIPREEEE